MNFKKLPVIAVVLILLFSACHSTKKVTYVQHVGETVNLGNGVQLTVPEIGVKMGDMLLITVSTISPEAAAPFNPPLIADPTRTTVLQSTSSVPLPLPYMVDENGTINFPVLGRISVQGMTKTQIEELIRSKLYPKYIKENPIVTMQMTNFRISVLGEVARPGVYTAANQRISIMEVIAQAGDLTIYGKRDNVLLIREDVHGKRETFRLDLRDKNLISSPFYYLQQNDVIYVQPNATKARSNMIGTGEYMIFTVIGTLVSITSLVVTLLK